MKDVATAVLLMLGFLVGLLLATTLFNLKEPNTFLISHTEDTAALVQSFTNRGDCLVQLEKEVPTNYKLTCWSKPNENVPK